MKKALQLIYSIYAMLVFIVLILSSFPVVLIMLCFKEETRVKLMHSYLRKFAFTWFFFTGVRPKVYNKHIMEAQDGCVIVCNHSSYLDAAAIYTCVDKLFVTLGKIEIVKAPLFGLIYKNVVVTLDRSNNMARARSVIKMIGLMKQGLDIIIFPEGTFKEERDTLLPFFDGAFRLGIDAGKPIIPLLLLDTVHRLHPTNLMRWSAGKSRGVFLPALSTAGLNKQDTGALKDKMYDYMGYMLHKLRTDTQCEDAQKVAEAWLASNQ
jgi:1-acyl-sn-glycerol-3-phosphate acyltransferase